MAPKLVDVMLMIQRRIWDGIGEVCLRKMFGTRSRLARVFILRLIADWEFCGECRSVRFAARMVCRLKIAPASREVLRTIFGLGLRAVQFVSSAANTIILPASAGCLANR